MKTGARFVFEDARVIRVKELPKVCFVNLLVQAGKYPDYHEVVLFQPPATLQLEEGIAITVTGDIQKKKPKEGEREWKPEFIGRNVIKGDDAKAPRPRQSTGGPTPSKNTPEMNQENDDGFDF